MDRGGYPEKKRVGFKVKVSYPAWGEGKGIREMEFSPLNLCSSEHWEPAWI